MAPLPVIPFVVRAAFLWTPPGGLKNAVNVMHFHSNTGDAAPLLTALEANVTASMWNGTSNTARIDTVIATPLDGTSASVVHQTAAGSKWAGNATAGETPPQVAAIVKFTTDQRGRSARGRIYLPFITEANQSSGVYSSSIVSAQQSAWDTFVAAMITADQKLCVASYKNGSFADVTKAKVEGLLATQRRRQQR